MEQPYNGYVRDWPEGVYVTKDCDTTNNFMFVKTREKSSIMYLPSLELCSDSAWQSFQTANIIRKYWKIS